MDPIKLLMFALGGYVVYEMLSQASSGTVAAVDPATGEVIDVHEPNVSLNVSDLATLAANAGFSGNDLAVAVAIAMAESGGNPTAYNPEVAAGTPDGYGSYGLWQIYLKAHPEFRGQNLYDPQTNANAAYRVYRAAGGFGPWSTFKSGAYTAYLQSVSDVVNV